MEWPYLLGTKFVLGQPDISSILKKNFQRLFILRGINTNSISVFILGKKGPMLSYCEKVHHLVTHSECSDFIICQFELSAGIENKNCSFLFPNTSCGKYINRHSWIAPLPSYWSRESLFQKFTIPFVERQKFWFNFLILGTYFTVKRTLKSEYRVARLLIMKTTQTSIASISQMVIDGNMRQMAHESLNSLDYFKQIYFKKA